MKILHVGSTDCVGGASRASYRLHKALEKSGVDSKMLVRRKSSHDPKAFVSGEISIFQNLLEKLTALPIVAGLTSVVGKPYWFDVDIWKSSPADWRRLSIQVMLILYISIGRRNGFLPVKTLSKIRKPLVWTLHDLWPILGVGHYDDAIPELNPKWLSVDWESRVESLKKKYWGNLGITAVGPSPWVIEQLSRMHNRPGMGNCGDPLTVLILRFSNQDLIWFFETSWGSLRIAPFLFLELWVRRVTRVRGGDLLEGVLEELAQRPF